MKILIVSMWEISKDCIGGTERYVIDLAESLKRERIDVEVLMLSGTSKTISGVKYIPINTSRIRIKVNEYIIKNTFFPKFTRKNLINFAKFIENYFDVRKYDLIHLNSLLFYYLFAHKNRVFTLHENPFEFDHNWGRGSLSKIRKIIISEKDKKHNFIVPSQNHGEEFNKLFSIRTKTILHCLKKDRLNCFVRKSEILKKYRLDQKLTFLIPSRLDIIQKGQDIAAKALGLAKKKIPEFQVVFSGLDDQYIENSKIIKKICDRYSIACYFIKFVDIKEAYEIADVVIIPSQSESFGYSALESLAIGKKTVLSNIPTFLDFAKLTPFAFVADLNPECFANKIVDAVKSKKVPQPEAWLKKYNPKVWADKYIKFYEEILRK